MATSMDRNRSSTTRKGPIPAHERQESLRSAGPGVAAAGPGPPLTQAVFQAIRRRGQLAVSLAILSSATCVAVLFVVRSPVYTATSRIHVAERKPTLVFDIQSPASKVDGREFRQAQQCLLASKIVAEKAIDTVRATCLPPRADRSTLITWLTNSLEVGFPSGTETMEVSLKGQNRQELAPLLDAVVQAYVAVVLQDDESHRSQRLADLARVYAEREIEVRSKRGLLHKLLTRENGTASADAASEYEIAMHQLGEVLRELMRYESMREDLLGEIEVRQAGMDQPGCFSLDEEECKSVALNDSAYAKLATECMEIEKTLVQVRSAASPLAVARFEPRYVAHRRSLEREMGIRMAELEQLASANKRRAALDELRSVQRQEHLAERRIAQLRESSRRWRRELEILTPSVAATESVVEAQMLECEIQQLERVLSTIAEDREQELVERAASNRVRVIQRAHVSCAADHATRVFLAGTGGLVAFLLPFSCILTWDLRQRLIGSPGDVSGGLGIRLLGVIPGPQLQHRRPWTRRLAPSAASSNVTEAVDSILVRLLREAHIEGKRVIAVCSSSADEGRGNIVRQITQGLARSDQRTLLVDGGLQNPTLHSDFGVPREPGVTDVITGSLETSEVLHDTPAANLWFISAGDWNQRSRAALANGAFGMLLDELSDLFDFVVIDAGAIRTGIDARYLCQSADTIVLSVMRDVSRTNELHVARSILESLGVEELTAIVCGATEAEQYDLPACRAQETTAWEP